VSFVQNCSAFFSVLFSFQLGEVGCFLCEHILLICIIVSFLLASLNPSRLIQTCRDISPPSRNTRRSPTVISHREGRRFTCRERGWKRSVLTRRRPDRDVRPSLTIRKCHTAGRHAHSLEGP